MCILYVFSYATILLSVSNCVSPYHCRPLPCVLLWMCGMCWRAEMQVFNVITYCQQWLHHHVTTMWQPCDNQFGVWYEPHVSGWDCSTVVTAMSMSINYISVCKKRRNINLCMTIILWLYIPQSKHYFLLYSWLRPAVVPSPSFLWASYAGSAVFLPVSSPGAGLLQCLMGPCPAVWRTPL